MLERSAAIIATLLLCAPNALADTQLFSGSWHVKAFGNERTGGTGASSVYSAVALPLGQQCNPLQPRCPFQSTPTDGKGNFSPVGGSPIQGLYCTPYTQFRSKRFTRYESPSHCFPWRASAMRQRTHGRQYVCIPPYRNPAFFTPGGNPNTTSCSKRSTTLGSDGQLGGAPGRVQLGDPLTGTFSATTTGTGKRAFAFPAAPLTGGGIRGKRTGQLSFYYVTPYLYTYADLRNASGMFGPSQGPGSFSIPYRVNALTVAKVAVKQGAARFGGTMRMLGSLTSKVCYFRAGGCSLGAANWQYDPIGASARTSGGVVTGAYQALDSEFLFNSALGQWSTVMIIGSRFPWTTGSVTVTAVGRGPHETVHYAKGYDNRTPTSGRGTIQLVSPTLTHWLQPSAKFETGGIAILRLQFAPEPSAGLMLVAGVGVLAAGYRLRHSRSRDSAPPH